MIVNKQDKIKKSELLSVPLFSGITENELNQLLYCCRSYEAEYKKGDFIILDDDKVTYVGIVLSGSVNMLKNDIYGNQTLLTYIGPGELFGENFAIPKEQNANVSFVAGQTTHVLFMAAFNLIHSCSRNCTFHQTLVQNFFDLLGKKSVRLMEKIEITSKTTIRDKILAYLSMLSQEQKSRYVTLPITKSELAEYLSVNRSAMMRELTNMRNDGLIDFDKNTFRILI